jgi:hypothetical protein
LKTQNITVPVPDVSSLPQCITIWRGCFSGSCTRLGTGVIYYIALPDFRGKLMRNQPLFLNFKRWKNTPKDASDREHINCWKYGILYSNFVYVVLSLPVDLTLNVVFRVQALTLCDAKDLMNLERLETLGDSCLKYLVSVCTYVKSKGMNEGDLTILRSDLVCNKNLFDCGKKLDIGSYINVSSIFRNINPCISLKTLTC